MNTSKCKNCIHWHNHYPNDGGVCTHSVGTELKTGLQMTMHDPDASKVIGDTMFSLYKHTNLTITHHATLCSKFKEK